MTEVKTALAVPKVADKVDRPPVPRDSKGQFPKGVSGNPAGRAKGTKNRITLARLMLEEQLREQLTTNGPAIMRKAVKMALAGDEKILRVLLDKMLATPKGDDSADARDNEVRVIVNNMTHGAPSATKVEGTNVRVSIPDKSPKMVEHK